MKGVLQLASVVILAAFAGSAAAQETQFFVPDTPFCMGEEEDCEAGDGIDFSSGQIAQHSLGSYDVTPPDALNLPGFVEIDCLHKLYDPGQWLFSPKNPLSFNDGVSPDPLTLEPGIQESIQFNDILRYDGNGNYSFFFKGQEIPQALDPGANLDACYMQGNDLIISLDAGVPTDFLISGTPVTMADLIRFSPTGPGPTDWVFSGMVFDASAEIDPDSNPATDDSQAVNLIGASLRDTDVVMSFRVIADTGPAQSFIPGEMATWNGTAFTAFEELPDWETSYDINALSLVRSDTCTPLAQNADPDDMVIDLCSVIWLTDDLSKKVRVEWRLETGASVYKVYTMPMSQLGQFGASPDLSLSCDTPGGIANTQFIIPDSAIDLVFLVSGVFTGIEGTLGLGAYGERNNLTPCP